MRWVSLFIFSAINFSGCGIAHAASDGIFRVSDWMGRAYWNKQEKQLDHCSAQLTNADKITIIYSLSRQYIWSLEISSPAWNFIKGASFQVAFTLGDRQYLRTRAMATEAQLAKVELSDSLSTFDTFRRVIKTGFTAGGLTSDFDLANNNQVLTALTKCVLRYGASSRSRPAIAAWLKSTADPQLTSHDNVSIHQEASALGTNILTEAGASKVVSIPQNGAPAGLTGDAFWKVGNILFSISVLSHEASAVSDLPSLIIGADAQKCRGDMFSGAVMDTIGALRVARAVTNCVTSEATSTTYYLVIPRQKGGVYLLETITNGFEIPALGELTAEEVDQRLRASIVVALSKLDAAK